MGALHQSDEIHASLGNRLVGFLRACHRERESRLPPLLREPLINFLARVVDEGSVRVGNVYMLEVFRQFGSEYARAGSDMVCETKRVTVGAMVVDNELF